MMNYVGNENQVMAEGDASSATRIEVCLIRHGNAKKLMGETYVTAPLSVLGRRQAELTGAFLSSHAIRFDGYYCSALRRARETAEIIGAQIGQLPQVREHIQEMEYREIPAMMFAELFARTGMLNHYFEARIGKPIRFPLLGRVANGMLEILSKHTRGRIGIVVHGGVISSVLSWYFPRERRRWWGEPVGNCSLTRIEIENARARLLEFDSTAHLGELASTAHLRNYTFSADEGV